MKLVFAMVLTAALLIPLLVFGAAPAIPDPSSDLGAFFDFVFKAINDKNWAYVVGALVIAFVFVARKFGPKLPKIGPKVEAFFNSDPGGVLLALASAFAVALVGQGGALSWAVVLAAGKAGIAAMGGFVLIKKLLWPVGEWLWNKLFPSGAEQAKEVAAGAAEDAAKVAETAATSPAAAAEAFRNVGNGLPPGTDPK